MEGKGERGGDDDEEQLLHDVRTEEAGALSVHRASAAQFTAPLKAPDQRIARVVTVI